MRGQGVPFREREHVDPGGELAAGDGEDARELDRAGAAGVAVAVPRGLTGTPVDLPGAERPWVEPERLLLGREVEAEQTGREQDRRAGAELDEAGGGDQEPAARELAGQLAQIGALRDGALRVQALKR